MCVEKKAQQLFRGVLRVVPPFKLQVSGSVFRVSCIVLRIFVVRVACFKYLRFSSLRFFRSFEFRVWCWGAHAGSNHINCLQKET